MQGKRNKIAINIIISFTITLLFFGYIITRYNFNLASDDAQMRAIASGALTGKPDAHLVYMKYILGKVIVLLYDLFPEYNCYGIFFICMFMVVMTIYLFWLLQRKQIFPVVIVLGISVICILPMMLELNFTYSATIVGSLALFLIICEENKTIWKNTGISLLLWLCFCIRDSVFCVILSFVCLHEFYQIWLESSSIKEIIPKYLKKYMICIILVLVTIIIENVAYASDEWNLYNHYNGHRSAIVDYSDWPSYETHQKLYKDNGIDEYTYELLDYSRLTIPNVDMYKLVESVDDVLEQEKSNISFKTKFVTTCYTMYNDMFSRDYSITNFIISFLLGISLIYCCEKDSEKYMYLKIVFAFSGYLFMWFYLTYIGRPLKRVILSIQLVLMIFLLAEIYNTKRTVMKTNALFLIKMIIVLVGGFMAVNSLNLANDQSVAIAKMNYDIHQISDYCKQHSDNVYFVKSSTYAFEQGNNWKNKSISCNVIYPGGWITNSPLFYEQLAANKISNPFDELAYKEKAFFISDNHEIPDIIKNYYNSFNNECAYVVTDQIDNGKMLYDKMFIYKFLCK